MNFLFRLRPKGSALVAWCKSPSFSFRENMTRIRVSRSTLFCTTLWLAGRLEYLMLAAWAMPG